MTEYQLEDEKSQESLSSGFGRLSIQWSKWIGASEFYSYGRFVLLDDSESHVISCEEEVCEDSLTPADQFARHTRSHGQKAPALLTTAFLYAS